MFFIRKEKTGPAGEHLFHLFVREKEDYAELWDGARSGVEAAVEMFNADHVISHINTLQLNLSLKPYRHMILHISFLNSRL
jgi:intermediate cleaving peptidase 55